MIFRHAPKRLLWNSLIAPRTRESSHVFLRETSSLPRGFPATVMRGAVPHFRISEDPRFLGSLRRIVGYIFPQNINLLTAHWKRPAMVLKRADFPAHCPQNRDKIMLSISRVIVQNDTFSSFIPLLTALVAYLPLPIAVIYWVSPSWFFSALESSGR